MSIRTRWALLISVAVHVAVFSIPLTFCEKAGGKMTTLVSVELIREAPSSHEVYEGSELETHRDAQAEKTDRQDDAPPAPVAVDEASVEKEFDADSLDDKIVQKTEMPADRERKIITEETVSIDLRKDEVEPADHADLIRPAVEKESSENPDVQEKTDVRPVDKPLPASGYGNKAFNGGNDIKLNLIRDRISSAQYYPLLARKRGWEGRTTVRFRIKGDGGLDSLELVESSGINVLDCASVKAVEKGAPYPPVEGWIQVPIVFHLTM